MSEYTTITVRSDVLAVQNALRGGASHNKFMLAVMSVLDEDDLNQARALAQRADDPPVALLKQAVDQHGLEYLDLEMLNAEGGSGTDVDADEATS